MIATFPRNESCTGAGFTLIDVAPLLTSTLEAHPP
jgi:hypothetical protein